MPLKLPNLDDRRYKDLVEEARSLIPTYSPKWTNHNPSDPGITLIELFAYLTEMMLYRANSVSDENRKKFLKLLSDPGWTPGDDRMEDARQAVQGIRKIYRAVTCSDYETLVMEQFATVARARCVPRRYLDAGTESDKLQEKPGHISVIIVPKEGAGLSGTLGPQPTDGQKQAVWAFLEERRMLTIRHHVVGPLYAPVGIEGLVIQRQDVLGSMLLTQMTEQIRNYLDPLPREGKAGWPFGRDVYVSEIVEELEKNPGVDYIADLMLASDCSGAADACVAAKTLWHEEGDQIGLAIPDHQLPALRSGTVSIIVAQASKILVISVTIAAIVAPAADPALARRMAKQAVRRFFHPLHDGPKPGDAAGTIMQKAALIAALSAIGEIGGITSLEMQSRTSRYKYDSQGALLGIEVTAGEVVDVRLRLNM